MFFGDIVAVYANEDCLTSGKPNPIKIAQIIMMGTSYCAYEKLVGSFLSEGKKLNHYSENAV
jgi:hypothetical protein